MDEVRENRELCSFVVSDGDGDRWCYGPVRTSKTCIGARGRDEHRTPCIWYSPSAHISPARYMVRHAKRDRTASVQCRGDSGGTQRYVGAPAFSSVTHLRRHRMSRAIGGSRYAIAAHPFNMARSAVGAERAGTTRRCVFRPCLSNVGSRQAAGDERRRRSGRGSWRGTHRCVWQCPSPTCAAAERRVLQLYLHYPCSRACHGAVEARAVGVEDRKERRDEAGVLLLSPPTSSLGSPHRPRVRTEHSRTPSPLVDGSTRPVGSRTVPQKQ